MKAQGGVLTICTWLSVNFGIVTFTSAEKAGDAVIADVYPSISLKKAMSREKTALFPEHALCQTSEVAGRARLLPGCQRRVRL
jgi:hypothetical protein